MYSVPNKKRNYIPYSRCSKPNTLIPINIYFKTPRIKSEFERVAYTNFSDRVCEIDFSFMAVIHLDDIVPIIVGPTTLVRRTLNQMSIFGKP